MRVTSFPQCCTTDVIYGLGHTQNQDYAAQTANDHGLADTVAALYHKMAHAKLTRMAMLTAVSTDQQKHANTAFRAAGWRCGPWAKSGKHSNTRTRLWYWLVQDDVPDLVTLRNKLGLTA